MPCKKILRKRSNLSYESFFFSSFLSELAKNMSEGPSPFRGGSITPDGLIDEDFEEEIGQPVVREMKITLSLIFKFGLFYDLI